jgi:hypothetical protein
MKLKTLLPITALLLGVFISGCKKKEEPTPSSSTAPTVVSNDPTTNATNIPINGKISVNFSEELDASSVKSENFIVQSGINTVAGVVLYANKTATFIPAIYLSVNTTYNVTISGVKNTDGVSLVKTYTWSFTTGVVTDATLPTVITTDPATTAVNVSLNHLVLVTFSKPMDPATLTPSVFTLMQGTTSIAGIVTYVGITATFTPTANLEANKTYTGTITTGAKDAVGNALGSNYTFTFTTGSSTDVVAPVVSSTDPTNSITGVVQNKVIAFTFSKAMNPLTLNNSTFTLYKGATAIAGTVAYSENMATFTPTSLLEANTSYTATITTGAKDLAGNSLAANTVWSFTTGSTKGTLAIVNLGTAGNYVILAKTAINNNSTSAITGDLGLSPAATSYITGLALTNATGYATSAQVNGKIYAADMVTPTSSNLTTAVNNMITAYNDAAGRPFPDFTELGTGNIGGKTLIAGLYKWTSNVIIPTDITLSGGATDVWIFQISGNLISSSAVKVHLTGGALAKNVFWQVAGQATLGTTSHFEGVILSMTSIIFQTGASINGRALAQTAVVMDANVVTIP